MFQIVQIFNFGHRKISFRYPDFQRNRNICHILGSDWVNTNWSIFFPRFFEKKRFFLLIDIYLEMANALKTVPLHVHCTDPLDKGDADESFD